MKCVDPENDFAKWRDAARSLLQRGIPPHQVLWERGGLFDEPVVEMPAGPLKIPGDFVKLAQTVACHKSPSRWPLLYQIAWRIIHGGERHLLKIASDPDIATAQLLAKAVGREIHKMHAFVRFKLVATDSESGRERYAAWFEPDHFIVEAGTPFFCKRFANMDWSIFTPKSCAHWNGELLAFTAGVAENPVEDPDALEAAWLTYYRSIFNPARLKVKMMKREMPVRYWKNLPEAELIAELVETSATLVNSMHAAEPRPARAAPHNAYLKQLKEVSAATFSQYPPDPGQPLAEIADNASRCQACPLYKNATATVFGEGPENARIMIVGEQPGDREDVAGKPFVGPAGRLLDRALEEAGVDRSGIYVTNAVKHFKWTPGADRRLHEKPNSGEIDACRPWVFAELSKVSPDVLILMGATAARSLFDKSMAVTKYRGLVHAPHLAEKVILTVHPSFLLRIPDADQKSQEYAKFIDDLRLAL